MVQAEGEDEWEWRAVMVELTRARRMDSDKNADEKGWKEGA
jgi:hypothetical protein